MFRRFKCKKRRDLKLKVAKYVIWDGKIFKRAIDGMFLRCVDKQQQEKLLKTFHDDISLLQS